MNNKIKDKIRKRSQEYATGEKGDIHFGSGEFDYRYRHFSKGMEEILNNPEKYELHAQLKEADEDIVYVPTPLDGEMHSRLQVKLNGQWYYLKPVKLSALLRPISYEQIEADIESCLRDAANEIIPETDELKEELNICTINASKKLLSLIKGCKAANPLHNDDYEREAYDPRKMDDD